jgi:hypothetical protein
MADPLRGSMDAGEHKHVVLGLIFLKYVSDTLRNNITVLRPRGLRALTRRIRRYIEPKVSSGSRPRRAGRT